MKLAKKPKLKMIWLLLVVVLGLLAVTRGSYAAYNSQDVQRGVARNRDTDAIRFTSNYLQPNSSDAENTFAAKILGFSESTKDNDSITIDIYVYNYVVGSNSLVNEKDITYNMSIQLKDGTGTQYKVTDNSGKELTADADNVYKKQDTLPGRTANSHHYQVTIPGKDLDKIKIIAKAVPENKSYTGNKILAAVIAPCTASKVQAFTCTGTFTDASDDANNTPAKYDAFNYEVAISGGQANVELTWNSGKVEIDPYFLEKIGKKSTDLTTESGKTTLKFQMDQTNGTGDYLIPFYRKSGTDDSAMASWEDMKNVISVKGTQAAGTN